MMRAGMTLAPMTLKTGGHTSMTQLEVTMIINNEFEAILDVLLDNDFYVLEKTSGQKEIIGAALKLYDRHVEFLDFFHYYSSAFKN